MYLRTSLMKGNLLYVAGSFHSTECPCQFLQLKGTLLKRMDEDLKGGSCLADELDTRTFFLTSTTAAAEKGKTRGRASSPGSESQTCHLSSEIQQSIYHTGLSFRTLQNMGFQTPEQHIPFANTFYPELPSMRGSVTRWVVSPPKNINGALISPTSECDLTWRQGYYRGSQVKMRSLGGPNPTGLVLTKGEIWTQRYARGEDKVETHIVSTSPRLREARRGAMTRSSLPHPSPAPLPPPPTTPLDLHPGSGIATRCKEKPRPVLLSG